ncbi:TetR family transcriptional regulator [Nocardioides sp. BP30]|uniref:TetR family transcriptional regulator n=1 Tax=Nocardioides sp. BP30 TaxID=3036374 RepID=UPI00246833A6|nr:TetR family transcriptional regulator [Nocardioides sp. BP30]WGL51293.1 TetR family transcriptional regulator [Nocardioides sp. BP30]
MSETRAEQKERTRRAILDAALELTAETGLAGLSLRGVAKRVGIVPTAFYRHFDSIDALGLALVEESLVSLRAMLRAVRQPEALDSLVGVADASVDVLVEHVHAQRAHFAFLARERGAGPATVREAIRREIELCEHELATDLARLTDAGTWSARDLRAVSGLIVMLMVAGTEELLAARREQEAAVAETTRTRLRMVLIGVLHWQSRA